jgi:predicted dehydrogenase
MNSTSRRSFLKAAGLGTLATLAPKTLLRAHGSNESIRMAVAGLNGRGGDHIKEWLGQKGVEIVYLVDPDTRTFGKRLKQIGDKGPAPKTVQDIRTALDDKNVDAISIATPNHWHSLMSIWACQAGKDVYVEKPLSHNVHEGKVAVEAAKKHNRIVAHGTQHRNSKWANVVEVVKSGQFGKLLISRATCYKDGGDGWSTRRDIGTKPFRDPPKELDFDLWLGPAPMQPFHDNLVHYRWHWFWDFGNGDIGNQGVHQMDIARWLIPDATLPKSVFSLGGRIGHKDQGQTPSSQIAIMDFGEAQLIFEVRGWKSKPFAPAMDGCDNVLHFEGGTIANGKFYPKGKSEGESLPTMNAKRGPGGDNHFANFIAAVRSRKVEDLNANVLDGHLSCALIHYANASHRLGTPVPFGGGAVKAAINGHADAGDSLSRLEEHLGQEHNIKLDDWPLTLGRKLTIDPATGMTNDVEANRLLKRQGRGRFVVGD